VTPRPNGRHPEPAIELHGVGKRYWQLRERKMMLRSILPFARPDRTEKWAVRDLDLVVEPGETIGILGRNGAGKTSLLRLLAGVSQPSTGSVTVRGRVAPLISVGVGFHPEMSGRENVYVNAMLLGMRKSEVEERFDEIVAFAELRDAIDTPVKFYSSGMFMRLGFSVAVHVDPGVLLVDEVLAVGDVAFQLKCLDRMREIKRTGTTVVLVSHSMHAIRLLCPRALLMRKGRLEFDGDAETAVGRHHELLSLDAQEGLVDDDTPGAATGGVTKLHQEVVGPDGAAHRARQDEPLVLRQRWRFDRAIDSPQVYFNVLADNGAMVYEMKTAIGREHRTIEAGEEVDIEIDFMPRLGGGTFRLLTMLTDRDGREVFHRDNGGHLLYLAPKLGTSGLADLGATIRLDGESLTEHDSLELANQVQAIEEEL
jgi:ABC-type polysaccharide/polyol phosphate transport system ATPase subunit